MSKFRDMTKLKNQRKTGQKESKTPLSPAGRIPFLSLQIKLKAFHFSQSDQIGIPLRRGKREKNQIPENDWGHTKKILCFR
jgi:hypothetical protein